MARVAVRSADDSHAVEADWHYDTYSREYGAACQTDGEDGDTGGSGTVGAVVEFDMVG